MLNSAEIINVKMPTIKSRTININEQDTCKFHALLFKRVEHETTFDFNSHSWGQAYYYIPKSQSGVVGFSNLVPGISTPCGFTHQQCFFVHCCFSKAPSLLHLGINSATSRAVARSCWHGVTWLGLPGSEIK